MKLIGPWPCIANGKIRLTAKRGKDGLTLIIQDDSHTGLDEVSIRMIGLPDAEIDAYEWAVRSFNNSLEITRAKGAA
jgi:hypothetical protein